MKIDEATHLPHVTASNKQKLTENVGNTSGKEFKLLFHTSVLEDNQRSHRTISFE
jgi:hypothetical protein